MRRLSTAVTITDPLVKYHTLLSAGLYSPDPAQHRLARHLRNVYLRIKDYSPQHEYRQRLSRVRRLVEATEPPDGADNILAVPGHAIWRNPLFRHLIPRADPDTRRSLALTRVLQDHELAIQIDSPKGLFLSGEVGTGKSMLLDLLADALPHARKKRWHFNTFMLYTFAQLDKHRAAIAASGPGDRDDQQQHHQHSLLWMAKKLVDESPILFLDEFQLPDRAASRILCNLLVAFFHLGGVLIASSNRVPEDLEKATGVDYASAPRVGIMRKIFGGGTDLHGKGSDFSKLLEVLKARCDFWQMDGVQDWRRREDTGPASHTAAKAGETTSRAAPVPKKDEALKSAGSPQNYFIAGDDDDNSWQDRIREAVFGQDSSDQWQPQTITVYGRKVVIPQHHKGTVFWDFAQLVGTIGPADYITMASSFHTFIVDKVPTMTVLQKNEARRFITFLDALYEARCKLTIRAESPSDGLFFPETSTFASASPSELGDDDATYSETIAEVYQDQISPFRPNVSLYDTKSATSRYDPDQDSDFVLEQDVGRGRGQGRHRDGRVSSSSSGGGVDFGDRARFTGEDERFAYKRAASRLWELCSGRWHARTGAWWCPLPAEARHWEGGGGAKGPLRKTATIGAGIESSRTEGANENMGESVVVDQVAGLSRYRIKDLEKAD